MQAHLLRNIHDDFIEVFYDDAPHMPAKSKKQQMAAGAALAAKRTEMPRRQLKGASKEMYDSITQKEFRLIANTKRKDLPLKKNTYLGEVFEHVENIVDTYRFY